MDGTNIKLEFSVLDVISTAFHAIEYRIIGTLSSVISYAVV
jgi:hypothetical protein